MVGDLIALFFITFFFGMFIIYVDCFFFCGNFSLDGGGLGWLGGEGIGKWMAERGRSVWLLTWRSGYLEVFFFWGGGGSF